MRTGQQEIQLNLYQGEWRGDHLKIASKRVLHRNDKKRHLCHD